MGLFDKSTNLPTHISFSTRSEAFTYMLNYLISEKKMEPMEAAKQANEFAEIFATNMGIPLKVVPEPKGVDKYLSMAEKIGTYIEEHPKVVEYGIPALTFVAGLFTGKKVEQAEDNNYPYQSIMQGSPQNSNAECKTSEDKKPINFDEID